MNTYKLSAFQQHGVVLLRGGVAYLSSALSRGRGFQLLASGLRKRCSIPFPVRAFIGLYRVCAGFRRRALWLLVLLCLWSYPGLVDGELFA